MARILKNLGFLFSRLERYQVSRLHSGGSFLFAAEIPGKVTSRAGSDPVAGLGGFLVDKGER